MDVIPETRVNVDPLDPDELSEHIEYWVNLLPAERHEHLRAWLQNHFRVVMASADGSLRELLARLGDEQRMFEAWTVMGEVVWQWQRSLKRRPT